MGKMQKEFTDLVKGNTLLRADLDRLRKENEEFKELYKQSCKGNSMAVAKGYIMINEDLQTKVDDLHAVVKELLEALKPYISVLDGEIPIDEEGYFNPMLNIHRVREAKEVYEKYKEHYDTCKAEKRISELEWMLKKCRLGFGIIEKERDELARDEEVWLDQKGLVEDEVDKLIVLLAEAREALWPFTTSINHICQEQNRVDAKAVLIKIERYTNGPEDMKCQCQKARYH